MTAAAREHWYRVVDAHHQGWHPVGRADGGGADSAGMDYAADYGFQRDLPDRSLEEVERDRGPLRPVLPVSGEDEQALTEALAAAGRTAVYTVAVAVQAAMRELREQHGGVAARDSWETTRRQLLAGREGSWESEALLTMALWADSSKVRRIHEPSREAITELILRWVTDPARYTEVAETLASIVSRYADEQERGWAAVADQWLQPGGLDREGVHVTYTLLYSRSEHFDPAVLQ